MTRRIYAAAVVAALMSGSALAADSATGFVVAQAQTTAPDPKDAKQHPHKQDGKAHPQAPKGTPPAAGGTPPAAKGVPSAPKGAMPSHPVTPGGGVTHPPKQPVPAPHPAQTQPVVPKAPVTGSPATGGPAKGGPSTGPALHKGPPGTGGPATGTGLQKGPPAGSATAPTTSPSSPGTPPAASTSTQPAANAPPPTGGASGAARTLNRPSALPVSPTTAPALPSGNVKDLQKARTQTTQNGATVITEPGNRTIVQQGNTAIVQHDAGQRVRQFGGANARTSKTAAGTTQTVVPRPNGAKVVTETAPGGQLVRSYRVDSSGRETTIVDNRSHFGRNLAIGVGIGALAVAAAVALAPPAIALPREKYIVEYDRASDDDLYEAMSAPPIERLERDYSLEEVRYSHELRQRMRRIDLDVNFESGAWELDEDQYRRLERIADIMLRMIDRRPNEVFLIEGHTDAVGSNVDNLSLSDRRAEAVADALTRNFGVPPENIVTQGYGEQYLKVPTSGPERANRRVAVRRITPLMAHHDDRRDDNRRDDDWRRDERRDWRDERRDDGRERYRD